MGERYKEFTQEERRLIFNLIADLKKSNLIVNKRIQNKIIKIESLRKYKTIKEKVSVGKQYSNSDYKRIYIEAKKRTVDGFDINVLHIKNHKNITIKKFIEDRKRTKSLDTTKSLKQIDDIYASKESIRKFFQNKAEKEGFKYNPVSPDELLIKEKNFFNKHIGKEYVKSVKTFQNENQLIFSNKVRIKNFEKNRVDYTYIQVKLKVFFDGVYIITSGRGRYYSKNLTKEELKREIHQAILNGLAPYGSNLKFELLEWNYVYHVNNSMKI